MPAISTAHPEASAGGKRASKRGTLLMSTKIQKETPPVRQYRMTEDWKGQSTFFQPCCKSGSDGTVGSLRKPPPMRNKHREWADTGKMIANVINRKQRSQYRVVMFGLSH